MSGITAATVTAAAAVASAGVGLASAAGLFGGGGAPKLPSAVIPAPPAPTRRTDTGSNIVLGANNVANQRVSGSRPGVTTGPAQADVIGGLGGGSGLSL